MNDEARPTPPQTPSPHADSGTAEADLHDLADGLRRVILSVEKWRYHFRALAGAGDTDLMALGNLASHGPMSAAELFRRLGITRSSVTGVVDRLESAQLAARHADTRDLRQLRLVITDAGEQALKQARTFFLDSFRTIEPQRLPSLALALNEVVDALGTNAPSSSDRNKTRESRSTNLPNPPSRPRPLVNRATRPTRWHSEKSRRT